MSEGPTADDAPQIIIDQNQGISVGSVLNISGTYIDEYLPETFTWKIFNGIYLVDEGDIIDSLTETVDSHESSRNSWEYSLNLNFSSYSPCSCLLEIKASDANNQIDVAQLILFSQGQELSELAPRIIFENPPNQLTGTVDINAIAMDDYGTTGTQWAISNSSEIAMSCIQSWIESPEEVQWHNITPVISSANQVWSLDSTDYDDGEYSLIVRALSDDGLTSPCACLTVGIDNHAPTSRIDGPSGVNESVGVIQFDGSGSSDQYWGREGLVFLWVLDGGPDGQIVESGNNLRTFDVDATISGNYTLTLTVADNAGFSDTTTHQFNITNQAPVARLSVGGQHLEDGDQVTLVDNQQWLIECGESIDSANDQVGLICTWHLDGVPTMTGWERQLQRPDDLSESHTLMLEVTDDDGASDTITVTFGVQGTPSDPMFSDEEGADSFWIMMMAIGAIVVVLFSTMILVRHFSGNSTSIPKWKRE
ncbi:MAG: hypothetical protein VYB17_03970 [Candidatus Thermoplasmatota archaeon]|nr:hypothetical protein [Candidatus Thermoplasmatota archaeon]